MEGRRAKAEASDVLVFVRRKEGGIGVVVQSLNRETGVFIDYRQLLTA